MKLAAKILLIIQILVFCVSCSPKIDVIEPIIPECEYDCNDLSKLEVVWSVPLNGFDDNNSNLKPFIYGNSVIVGATPTHSNNEIIYSFDILTGKKNWEWKNYLNYDNPTSEIFVCGNLAAFSYSFRDYVFDLNSGETLWRYETPLGISSSPRFSVINNFIYHPTEVEGVAVDSVASIARTSVYSPNWEILYTMKRDSTLTDVNLEPPSLWVNPDQDSVLIFQRRSYNWIYNYDYQELLAFNLKTRKLVWKIKNIDSPSYSSVHPILISNNIGYFFGGIIVYAIDLLKGKILWTSNGVTQNSNGLTNASCLIIDDKLVIKTNDRYVYALDKVSGKLKWFREIDMGYITGPLVYSLGRIYLQIFERLCCIDANTGVLIFKYRSPNAKRKDHSAKYYGTGGVAIDPVRKLIFIADSYYLNCMKIPD